MNFERFAVVFNHFEEHRQGSRSHVQFAATYDARQLKQQRKPTTNPRSIFFVHRYVIYAVLDK